MMSESDLKKIATEWLGDCGPLRTCCLSDSFFDLDCLDDHADPRPVISQLVAEVQRLHLLVNGRPE